MWLFYHSPPQGCAYYWLSKIQRTISIWCGSQLAGKSFRVAFSKLSQDEDVHSAGCGPHELGNSFKLFQCSFLWQLSGYKVLTFLPNSPSSFCFAFLWVERYNLIFIMLLGTSLCHRLFSLTVYLGIFPFSLLSSGVLALRQTFIM